jgi:ribosomal protein S18 acetylase RimI-like enzyme
MATRTSWTIRPFEPGADDVGVVRLLRNVATFDGSVPAWSEEALSVRCAHPLSRGGKAWRVAVKNDAIIGALIVTFVGTLRTNIVVAVNPAFRRQGIGRDLLAFAPTDRRLLCTSRGSVAAATALLSSTGFVERFRSVILRQEAGSVRHFELDDGFRIAEDIRNDARRAAAIARLAMGDDIDDDPQWLKVRLARPRCKALYLESVAANGAVADGGLCIVAPCDRAKKGERTASGEAIVGVLEDIGLVKALRGRGLSRALVRAGMRAIKDAGFRVIEATADKRREAAVELYVKEGFEVIDEEIHWVRKEDTPVGSMVGRT